VLVIEITWRSAAVGALATVSSYLIMLVAWSYCDHPRVVPWLKGSEDYRRWNER
jgi:hypothetical protein